MNNISKEDLSSQLEIYEARKKLLNQKNTDYLEKLRDKYDDIEDMKEDEMFEILTENSEEIRDIEDAIKDIMDILAKK